MAYCRWSDCRFYVYWRSPDPEFDKVPINVRHRRKYQVCAVGDVANANKPEPFVYFTYGELKKHFNEITEKILGWDNLDRTKLINALAQFMKDVEEDTKLNA